MHGRRSARSLPRGVWSRMDIVSRCSKKGRSVDVPRSGQAVLTGCPGLNTLLLPSAPPHSPALLHLLPPPSYPTPTSSRAPCSSRTASNPLYTLPISTSLHRLTTVYGGRAALPCHPPTYPKPTRQCAKTRRHRTWHCDTFSGKGELTWSVQCHSHSRQKFGRKAAPAPPPYTASTKVRGSLACTKYAISPMFLPTLDAISVQLTVHSINTTPLCLPALHTPSVYPSPFEYNYIRMHSYPSFHDTER